MNEPLLDREALTDAFMAFRERNGGCPEGPNCAACRRIAEEEADVALKLARPMPTREQIAEFLRGHYQQHGPGIVSGNPFQPRCVCGVEYPNGGFTGHLADAVRALLNGTDS